jgi:hypothetical protein
METPGCGFSGERWKRWSSGKHGANYLKDQQKKTELARINRELKRLKTQMAALEERKAELIGGAGKSE